MLVIQRLRRTRDGLRGGLCCKVMLIFESAVSEATADGPPGTAVHPGVRRARHSTVQKRVTAWNGVILCRMHLRSEFFVWAWEER